MCVAALPTVLLSLFCDARVRGAGGWSDRAEAAIVVELSAPTARPRWPGPYLLADQDVVNAAVKVSEVPPPATAVLADTPLIPTRKKAAAIRISQEQADTALQDALGELITVARERLHPAPQPRSAAAVPPGEPARSALPAAPKP